MPNPSKPNQPQTLADLISLAESSGKEQAVRFEPGHRPASQFVSRMMNIVDCNVNTAKVLCAMSWGEFQIMGDELVDLGLNVSPLDFVQDAAMQLDFFNRFVKVHHIDYTLDQLINNQQMRENFALHYNGPAHVADYSDYLMRVFHADDRS